MILNKTVPKHVPIKYCICKWHVMTQIDVIPDEASFIKRLLCDDDSVAYFKTLLDQFNITLNIDHDSFINMKHHFIDVNKHIINESNILEPNIRENSMLDASIVLQKLIPISNDKSYVDDNACYTVNLNIEDTQNVIPLHLYKYEFNIPSIGIVNVVPSWINIDSVDASYVLAESPLLDKLMLIDKNLTDIVNINENFLEVSSFVKKIIDTYKSCHIINSQILTLLNYINSAIKTVKG